MLCPPRGGEAHYWEDFWDWPLEKRHARMHDFEFCVTQNEVIPRASGQAFDAADCSRFGRDIFVQESMTTNRAGIRWLKRHLEPRGFRVHPVHFPLDFFPSHIDCTFVPLCPGVILTNPERAIREGSMRSSWIMIGNSSPPHSRLRRMMKCRCSANPPNGCRANAPTKVVCEEVETALRVPLG